jgi:uncharacterized protein (DUF58 family)
MNSFLKPEYLVSLDKFTLRARFIVEGFMIGLHKSPYHGFSVEFSDHRQYNPGDPIPSIDWKVYAKTNRYYIKRYEEETNLKCYLLFDHSKSMDYTSGDIKKLDYAKAFSSALIYLMNSQRDAVGFLSYSDEITNYLPPRSMKSYTNLIFSHLYNLQAEAKTNTAEALHHLADRIKKRGLVIIISDLIDEPEKIILGLQHFRHQKHEVILFHIQDLQEMEFDFKKETQFIDAESGEKIIVNPWQIKKDYQISYQESVNFLKHKCHELRIEYNPICTKTPFETALLQYLIKRARLY